MLNYLLSGQLIALHVTVAVYAAGAQRRAFVSALTAMLRLNVKQLVKQQKPPLNKSCCKVIASVSTFCCSKQARRVPPRLCKVEHLSVVHDSRWLNYWKKIRKSKFRRKWKRRWTHAGLQLYKHVTQPNHKSAPANCLQWCVCSSPHTHRSILYQCWIIIIFACHVILFYFAPVHYTLVSYFCLREDTNDTISLWSSNLSYLL